MRSARASWVPGSRRTAPCRRTRDGGRSHTARPGFGPARAGTGRRAGPSLSLSIRDQRRPATGSECSRWPSLRRQPLGARVASGRPTVARACAVGVEEVLSACAVTDSGSCSASLPSLRPPVARVPRRPPLPLRPRAPRRAHRPASPPRAPAALPLRPVARSPSGPPRTTPTASRRPEDRRRLHGEDRHPGQAGRDRRGPASRRRSRPRAPPARCPTSTARCRSASRTPSRPPTWSTPRPRRRSSIPSAGNVLAARARCSSRRRATRRRPERHWAQLLVYRKDLFDKAGLAAPTTFDTILSAATRRSTRTGWPGSSRRPARRIRSPSRPSSTSRSRTAASSPTTRATSR